MLILVGLASFCWGILEELLFASLTKPLATSQLMHWLTKMHIYANTAFGLVLLSAKWGWQLYRYYHPANRAPRAPVPSIRYDNGAQTIEMIEYRDDWENRGMSTGEQDDDQLLI